MNQSSKKSLRELNTGFLQENELIQDVFDNLLINAIRYNQNYQVEIQVKISEVKEHTVNMIKLEFIDNGNGIKDLRKDKNFLRGNKEDKYISGMGLGLSLVVKIVDSYADVLNLTKEEIKKLKEDLI